MNLPRHAELWLMGACRSMARARRESRQRRGTVDILFAVADHYEPLHGGASRDVGLRRVEAWHQRYPALASAFVDADGRHPQHTFFYPIEQYAPGLLDPLASLCAQGFGEVEIHLHHDGDTASHLRADLTGFARTLHERHGLLSRDEDGAIRYAFIHGNWALGNSLPDRRWCGVDDELAVLHETGCYGDFTFPAAPSAAQTRAVNLIYYADVTVPGPKSHDRGRRAEVGRRPARQDLLLLQGPLKASFRQPKWGFAPRLENSELHSGHPGTIGRFADWLSCGISVAGRAEWIFIKVHTHGAPESEADMLLGPETAAFHRDLLAAFNDGTRFRLHYVTPREMANIVHAAEDGKTGNPAAYRDFLLPPPPIAVHARSAYRAALVGA